MTKTTKSASAPKAAAVRTPKRITAAAKSTKKTRLIALLSRKNGADVPSLSKTLGWLPHTTRAALTGLRKAGYQIAAVKAGNGKPSRYQIIGAPEADAA